jgi:hypothetical protein
VKGRVTIEIEHPPGEEIQWDWLELPDAPWGGDGHLPHALSIQVKGVQHARIRDDAAAVVVRTSTLASWLWSNTPTICVMHELTTGRSWWSAPAAALPTRRLGHAKSRTLRLGQRLDKPSDWASLAAAVADQWNHHQGVGALVGGLTSWRCRRAGRLLCLRVDVQSLVVVEAGEDERSLLREGPPPHQLVAVTGGGPRRCCHLWRSYGLARCQSTRMSRRAVRSLLRGRTARVVAARCRGGRAIAGSSALAG